MPHFVYMLRCKGNRIYTGYAVDVQARFDQHVSGRGARFTKAFPPECILRTFELDTKEQALRLEARIKKLDRPRKELLANATDEGVAQSLLALLMSGLSETLQERRTRMRRATKKRGKKSAQSSCSSQSDQG